MQQIDEYETQKQKLLELTAILKQKKINLDKTILDRIDRINNINGTLMNINTSNVINKPNIKLEGIRTATDAEITNIELFFKNYDRYHDTKKLIPQDYKDDFSSLESLKRGVSFTTKRLGLTLDSGVDRLIFKNQDYLKFFDKKFLFDEGYFSTENEYNNAMNPSKRNKINKSLNIESGTNTIATLFDDKKTKKNIKLYSRIKDVLQYDNSKYYLLEYKKKKTNTKTILDKVKSGFNTFTGNSSEKEINKSIEWRDTKKNTNPDEIISIYADFKYPIPAKLVEIDPMSKDKFFKLNDQIFIPFKEENKNIFVVFHILKYCFKKALNYGRINKLFYILKTLKNEFVNHKEYYDYYKNNTLPKKLENLKASDNNLDNDTLKNIEKSRQIVPSDVEKITNEIEKLADKDRKEDENEIKNAAEDNLDNNANAKQENVKVGGKKTKKNEKINRKTKKNIQYGGVSISGTVKGDINVIIDKLSKYIFTENLKSNHVDIELKDTMLEYIIEEQQLFINAAIYYFGIDIELKDITYENYNLDVIDTYINENNYKNKDTYDLIKILADKIWPKRVHQNGGDINDEITGSDFRDYIKDKSREGFEKTKEGIDYIKDKSREGFEKTKEGIDYIKDKSREGFNEASRSVANKIDSVSNLVFANNVKLNRIFDIAFRKMIDRRIEKLFTTSSNSSNEEELSTLSSFYSAIKFSTILSAHFTCSTALNITAGILSNPLSITGLPILPPFIKGLTSANTPQCYISMMLCAYAMFRM